MAAKKIKVSNVPNLRFPGFEGEWEYNALEPFIDVISGVPLESEDIAEDKSGLPILRGINITEGAIRHSNQIDRYYSKALSSKFSRFLLQEGDLVIGMDGSKVGKNVSLISRSDVGSLLIQRVARLRALSNANIGYIYQKILSKQFQKYVDVVNTSSGIPHISLQQIKDFETSFPPTPAEQQQISKVLTLIDKRIQTQNKIIGGLISLKVVISKKILSQKLRFKDDNGNSFQKWEIKKLKDVCEVIGGGTPETKKAEYWSGDIQWFTPTEIKSNFVSKSERTISELGLKNSSAKLLPKGAILLTTRATIGEVAITLKECSTNQGFQSLIVKENCNNVFLFNWLKVNKFELEKRANGSTFSEISKSAIEKIEINIPSVLEQQKIVNILSSIDTKIDVEGHLLEKLKDQKKYFLANLFI